LLHVLHLLAPAMAKCNQDSIRTAPELSTGTALIAEEQAFTLKHA